MSPISGSSDSSGTRLLPVKGEEAGFEGSAIGFLHPTIGSECSWAAAALNCVSLQVAESWHADDAAQQHGDVPTAWGPDGGENHAVWTRICNLMCSMVQHSWKPQFVSAASVASRGLATR